uniref:Rhodanese domain-containing protein n=1 Tax=Parascaris equorum TaxID=6256 RepID=A0A914RHC5_PAREQ
RLHGVISHAPGANSFDTFSRHESFYEGKGCRKRCSHPEQPNAKRRYDVCRTDDGDYSLRTLSKPQIDSVAFKSIDGTTLAALMDSMELSEFERKFVIVDCRYPYEYNGGHIRVSYAIRFDVMGPLKCQYFGPPEGSPNSVLLHELRDIQLHRIP